MVYGTIPKGLCQNGPLNSGAVAATGCDGVACPLGTYAEYGYATSSHPCRPCPEGETSMYLGSTACRAFTEADLLNMFYDVMVGDNWMDRDHWRDMDVDVCEWYGIECLDGEIISLRFPGGVEYD